MVSDIISPGLFVLQVVWEKSACLFIYEAIHTTGLFAPRGLLERLGASEPWGGDAWPGGGGGQALGVPRLRHPAPEGQHGAHAAASH